MNHDPVDKYIAHCREILRDPNSSFSAEGRAAGKHFLDCWDAWKAEADKHQKWRAHFDHWYVIFVFPFYMFWTVKWDMKCNALYKELNEAQDRFNELTTAYRKQHG